MGKTGKTSRAAFRALLSIIAIIALFALAILGLRWHNGDAYTVMQQSPSMGPGARYETSDSVQAVEGDYLRGFRFSPEERTHPGTIVVYGGSEGSPNYEQAKLVSERGYEVLALYFWGQEGQAPTLANVPLEQFDEVESYVKGAIDQPTPITVIGTSKGAEFSAELAAHGFAIDNLVAFAPADRSYFGLDYTTQDELPSFTYRGEAVPFASYRDGDAGATAKLMWDMATGYPPSYRATYESAAEGSGDEGRIDLSGFGGNALFFAGGEDAMWQSDVAAEALAVQSERFEARVYPDAGHIFSEHLDELGSGWEIMFGGTAEGGAAAYESSTEILFDRLSRWHGQM